MAASNRFRKLLDREVRRFYTGPLAVRSTNGMAHMLLLADSEWEYRYGIGSEQHVECNLDALCAECGPDARILKVLQFIDAGPHEHVTIESAARLVDLSVSRLRHLFKQSTAMPFHQYVRMRRFQKARELLMTSSLQVQEIAARVGVGDMSHFVRDYRLIYGVSPHADRRRTSRS